MDAYNLQSGIESLFGLVELPGQKAQLDVRGNSWQLMNGNLKMGLMCEQCWCGT